MEHPLFNKNLFRIISMNTSKNKKIIITDTNIFYYLIENNNKIIFSNWLNKNNFIHGVSAINIFELINVVENTISSIDKKNKALDALRYIYHYCDFTLADFKMLINVKILRHLNKCPNELESSDFQNDLKNYLLSNIELKTKVIENVRNCLNQAHSFISNIRIAAQNLQIPKVDDDSSLLEFKKTLRKFAKKNQRQKFELTLAHPIMRKQFILDFLTKFIRIDDNIANDFLVRLNNKTNTFFEMLFNYYIVLLSNYSNRKKIQKNDREDWLFLIHLSSCYRILTSDKNLYHNFLRAIDNMSFMYSHEFSDIKDSLIYVEANNLNLP